MPAHPDTGIDYDVDRFVIQRVSDGVIINQNAKWQRPDGGPIVGGNPDQVYYKKVFAAPLDPDHRFTVEATWTLVPTDPAPPTGYPVGIYEQTLAAVKLDAESLKAQVDTHFQHLVQQWFPTAHDPAVLVEAAGAIIRKGQNATLTSAQEATLAAVVGIEDAIRQNRARLEELHAAIDADEDYDIEEGWVSPAPEEEA